MGSVIQAKRKSRTVSDRRRDGWDTKTVLDVRTAHQAELRNSRNLRNLLDRMRTNVYQGGPIRCIPELIQNAQDEGADEVRFVLEQDAIVCYNNGEPFRDYQVEDICSIAQSHKGDAQIGWMGLGFKSVFTVSDHPQVTSGRYNFSFEDLILPRPAQAVPRSEWLPAFSRDKGAWFRLPLKEKTRGAREAILKGWRGISPNLLLFLPGIRRVEFVDGVRRSRWEFRKELESGGIVVLTRSDAAQSTRSTRWRIFESSYEQIAQAVGHKKHVPSVRLAFPLDSRMDCSAEPLYCYLPTGSPGGLNFLVHADFGLSLSREGLLDDEFNRTLLRLAGIASADAITSLAQDVTPPDRAFGFIPTEGEVQNPQVQLLESSMLAELKKREFALTEQRRFARPASVVIADDRMRTVVSEGDLRRLFRRTLAFIAPPLRTERALRVLRRLGARDVTVRDVMSLLLEPGVERRRTPTWFLNCYDVLSSEWGRTQSAPATESEHWWNELRERSCVLTTARRLVPPGGRQPGEIVSYPHGQGATELERTFRKEGLYVVHKELWTISPTREEVGRTGFSRELEASRQRIKDFLCDALGVRRQADVVAVIEDVILPRLERAEALPAIEAFRLTNYVRRNLVAYQARLQRSRAEARTDPLRRVRDRIKLKCRTRRRRRWILEWRAPGDAYLGRAYSGSADLDQLFERIEAVSFVADDYLKERDEEQFKGRGRSRTRIPSWREFFEQIGVHTKLAVREVRLDGVPSDDTSFAWLNWPDGFPQYYRSEAWRHDLVDWRSEHLSLVLEAIEKLAKRTARFRASVLWRHLEANWADFYSRCLHAEYRYSYRGTWRGPIRQPTSSFREALRNSAWVPVYGGPELCPPAELFHPRNRPLLGDAVKYPLLDSRRAFAEGIGIHYQLTRTEVIERLEALRSAPLDTWPDNAPLVRGLYHQLFELGADEGVASEFKRRRLILATSGGQRSWWSPDECLWANRSDHFGGLFGYLSPLYDARLQPFFQQLGSLPDADALFCLRALRELHKRWERTKQDERRPDAFTHLSTRILLLLEEMIQRSSKDELAELKNSVHNLRLAATSGRYLRPQSAFLPDFREAQDVFASKISYLDVKCDPTALQAVASFLGVPSLMRSTSLRLIRAEDNEADPGRADRFGFLMQVLSQVLAFKFPDLRIHEEYSRRLDDLKQLRAYESEQIEVELKLRTASRVLIETRDRRAFIDPESSCAWTKPGRLLSGDLAPEIARLFPLFSNQVRLLCRSILEVGIDDDQLSSFLREEGVPETGIEMIGATLPVEAVPQNAGAITQFTQPDDTKEDSETGQSKTSTTLLSKPQPPVLNLIDPEEFFVSSRKDPAKTGHPKPRVYKRAPRRPKGNETKGSRPTPQGRLAINTFDKERAAINLAMQVEEREGRIPKDVHETEGLGYDILSTVPGADREIEVEVKMAKLGEPFVMQPNQWERAKIKGDDYYVHLVGGLVEGEEPAVHVIQNPARSLTPALPTRIEIQKWDAAATTHYAFQKRKSKRAKPAKRA